MWTGQTTKLSNVSIHPDNDYGLGWIIGHLNETTNPTVKHRNFKWHFGSLSGVTASVIIHPEQELVAVALTNKGEFPRSVV